MKETGLPTWEDVYAPKPGDYNILRTLTVLKTDHEREMSMGEDYNREPVPFGKCLIQVNWAHHQEIEIYKFRFDYF